MYEMLWDHLRLRQSVIAGMSLALMLSSAGCESGGEPSQNENVQSNATDISDPTPLPIAPVGRAELLAAAAAAADEAASGNALPEANRELTGRTFELRLPIGCQDGLSTDWGEWSIDPATKVLRISVRPEVWADNPVIKAMAEGATFDSAEGFWIARPWTRSEACPSPIETEAAPASSAKEQEAAIPNAVSPIRTFAIVQYFSPEASRTLRRGSRPYSYTGKVPDTETIGAAGFRLKLTGRIRDFSDGQPIHCVVTAPSLPPICAARVEFTEVALEDADTGKSLATWRR